MLVLTTIWVVLLAGVIALALVRRRIAGAEDESLHVLDSEKSMATRQQMSANLLNRIDKWNTVLVITMIGCGVALLIHYLYIAWQQGENFVW
jgi:hypothetical protein